MVGASLVNENLVLQVFQLEWNSLQFAKNKKIKNWIPINFWGHLDVEKVGG